MRGSLVLLLAVAVSTPAVARITAEVPVSTPLFGNAPGAQFGAVVGSSNADFLAVWNDQREGVHGTLYATRLSSSGTVLDSTNIRIPTSISGLDRIVVAVLPTTDAYVILWSERDFLPSAGSVLRIFATRIGFDGRLIDGSRMVLEGGYAPKHGAATNGRRIIVAYGDRYAILDEQAMVIERDLRIPNFLPSNVTPAVSSNGSGFLIVWSWFANRDSQYAALDVNGHPIATGRMDGLQAGAVASDGDAYLVVAREPGTQKFFARRITANAQALDVPQPISSATGTDTIGDLVSTGNEYVLALTTITSGVIGPPLNNIYGLRLDRNGQSLDPVLLVLAAPQTNVPLTPSLAWNGRTVALVWHGIPFVASPDHEIFAGLFEPAAFRYSAILLSRSANVQMDASLALSGKNFLAAWQEPSGIYFGRLSLEGQPLDGRGKRMSRASGTETTPRVAFDGTNYFVAWITVLPNVSYLSINRVTPERAELLDGDGIPITWSFSRCEFNFDILSGRGTTLIAWDDCGLGAIHVRRFNSSAQPIDLPLMITPQGLLAANPSIAWNGSEYLIAFQEKILRPGINFPTFRANIRAVRVSAGMTLLDPQPIAVAVSEEEDQAAPHAASNGREFLVVWTRQGSEVRARRVAGDADAVLVTDGIASSVVWDGLRYAVAFTSAFNTFLTHIGSGDRLVISATADDETTPRLVATSTGNVTATYIRVATEPLYGGVSRAFVREPSSVRPRPTRPR